jgi:hypothetical protein
LSKKAQAKIPVQPWVRLRKFTIISDYFLQEQAPITAQNVEAAYTLKAQKTLPVLS